MGAAFNTEIDLDKSLAESSSLLGARSQMKDKLKILESLNEAVKNFVGSISHGSQVAKGLDNSISKTGDVVGELISKIDNFVERLQDIPEKNVFDQGSLTAKLASGAFNIAAKGAKALGTVIRLAISPLRLLFFLFKLIGSLNPFSLLQSGVEKLTELLNKTYDVASGSSRREVGASSLRTSSKNLRVFEQASEMTGIGFDKQDVSSFQSALADPNKHGSLVGLGLDPEQLKKMDGIQAFIKAQKSIRSQVQAFGGWDSEGATSALKPMLEDIGLNYDDVRGQDKFLDNFLKVFEERQKNDKYDDKSMTEFEKTWNRMKAGLDDVVNKLFSIAVPLLTKLVDKLMGWLEAFTNWMENSSLIKYLSNTKEVLSDISKTSEEVLSGISKVSEEALSKGKSFWNSMVEGVSDAADSIARSLGAPTPSKTNTQNTGKSTNAKVEISVKSGKIEMKTKDNLSGYVRQQVLAEVGK